MKTKSDNNEPPAILVRLQQFIDRMHLTAYQVNKEAGLCKGLLINAINKKQGLTASTLEALLLAYPQLNANWLICGRGEMLNDVEPDAATSTSTTKQHIENLDLLQKQCVTLIQTIQQMKQKEMADEDERLLNSLLKQ